MAIALQRRERTLRCDDDRVNQLLPHLLSKFRVILLLVALAWLAPVHAVAQPAGPNQPVTIEYADKIVGNEETGVTELVGSARVTQGVTRISADRIIHYRDGNRVELIGSVRVVQPGTTLLAPRAEYDGNSRLATAPSGITIHDGDATIRASSGTYDMYSHRAAFAGGVTMTDPKGHVRAGSADYFSDERRAEFHRGVTVTTDSGSISARELSYWRDSQETYAQGDVVVIPKQRDARLTGQALRHIPAAGYTVVTGAPKLVDVDTASNGRRDTTVITAAKLEAYRTAGHEEYVATDSVRLRRGNLEAMAARANYSPDDEMIGLGSGLRRAATAAPADTGAITGLPIDTLVAGDTVARPASRPDPARFTSGSWPVVWYEESQLSGDTITVRLQKKELRAIDVVGDALAVTEKEQPERFDQLAGVRLLFSVAGDTIRQVRSEDYASSVMFIEEEGKPSGAERISADTVVIDFAGGEAEEVSVYGPRARIEGDHYPEALVTGEERNFRLDNFRWITRPRELVRINGRLPKEPSIAPVRGAPEGD
jgi:lipopolysaccharide export system protein LptA